MYKLLLPASAALVLSGCNPETLDGPMVEPKVQRFGVVSDDISVEYDDVSDTILVTSSAPPISAARVIAAPGMIELVRNTGLDTGDFSGYENPTYSTVGHFAQTSTGDGYAGIVISQYFGGIAGGEFGRLGDTALPASGSANYTGSYAGWFSGDGVYLPTNRLGGDVALMADFDSNQISGAITNRTIEDSPFELEDLTLNAANISGGEFSGTTSGGVHTYPGATVSNGAYSGMFTGADGQEIVGGVTMEHDFDGVYLEVGAFVVEQ